MIDIDIVLLVLKIGVLALLYVFIWRVVRAAVRNVRSGVAAQAPDVVVPAMAPAFTGSSRDEAQSLDTARNPVGSPARPVEPRLIVETSESLSPGVVFPVETGLSIGRSPTSDVMLNEGVVSGMHARIVVRGRAVSAEDLGSTNGTFVDGMRINEAPLRHGSRLRVGDTVFRYEE